MHVRVTQRLVPFVATTIAATLLLYACHRSIVSNYVRGHSLDQQDHLDPAGFYNVPKMARDLSGRNFFQSINQWFSPLPITATNCRHNNYCNSISTAVEVPVERCC
eukprot:SAG11_NODE_277_length_11302_cov_5.987146_10_plen_106_part_00